ncbi:MAG: alpha/beta fold hydrolase [Acidimicrobiales bacterium]
MAFAPVNGIDICYEIHGDGPRVVLISGTGGDLRQNPARHRHPLTAGHRVLMYDQRGLGRTTKPTPDGAGGPPTMAGSVDGAGSANGAGSAAEPPAMADYADDAAALLGHLGWEGAHVVGISFGGMVAQHLAIRHPGRVERLVLACTSSGGAGGASFDLRALEGLAPEERLRTLLPIMDTRNDPGTNPPTLAPGFEPFVAGVGGERPNAGEPGAAEGARLQLLARAGHDAWDGLPRITAPTLVIGGRFDAQAPPVNVERLAARIPGAELAMFDGGHLFLAQDRSAWPAVVEFLDRPSSTGPADP